MHTLSALRRVGYTETQIETIRQVCPSERALFIVPNVKDQTRPQLARSVLLGAQSVTAVVVVCIAWFGFVVFIQYFGFVMYS